MAERAPSESGSAPSVSPPSARAVILLGMVAVWLVLAGIVGAIHAANDGAGSDELSTGGPSDLFEPGETGGPDPSDGSTVETTSTTSGGEAGSDGASGDGSGTTGGGGDGGGTTGGDGGDGDGTTTSTTPGDRTGVSASTVKYGLHAPLTIGGAPLPLAEDPVKGVKTYLQHINERGGINGRKIELDLQDDRYETRGGATAAAALIEHRNFFISGTLGVDQIYVVANEARKAGVPYIAAGGPESVFKDIGMHQLGTSYDTHVIQLARFMARDPELKGKRIGISALDSPYIEPVVDVFEAEADRLGLDVVATETVKKPTEQTTYAGLRQRFVSKGVEVVIPMQDPITTSRIVAECTRVCGWTYTFSNFAHEADVALTLFGGEWGRLGVKGLAGGCYYMSRTANDPSRCAAMGRAHEQWVAIHDEADWEKDGQGGASGYQLVYFWVKAMTDAGRDLTRERFLAAMNAYDGYSNLVSSPITFVGSSNYAHGSEKMVVFRAQTNNEYEQLTPGFVEY